MQTLSDEEATRLAGGDSDYGIKLLSDAIESGKFPSWTVSIVRVRVIHWLGPSNVMSTANYDSRTSREVPLQHSRLN